jgi:predicted enzyme related to lactoylglutathione lyase
MTTSRPEAGTIGWIDMTVEDAPRIRDFYAEVVGWRPEAVDMGSYSDFNMTTPESATPAAGVCHRQGTNAELPRGWVIYIHVADLDASVAAVEKLGGRIVVAPKTAGGMGRYCMIEDPGGATCALFEPA